MKRKDQIFVSAEKMPEFPGKAEGLKRFIEKHLRFPENLKAAGISGNVFVEFIVDINGSVKEVTILRGIHPELDREAIRVIKLTSGMWKPGREGDQAVRVRLVIPVTFG